MSKRDIEKAVEGVVRPVVEEMGLSLVEVRFAKEGPVWLLRLIISRPEGIGLSDCEGVSQRVSPLLDEMDLIQVRYNLEVSSPGLERVFKSGEEYAIFAGRKILVSTYAPVENHGREIRGTLIGLADAEDPSGTQPASKVVRVATAQGEEVAIPLSMIANTRLDEVDLPHKGKGGGRRK
ncbi:MAG: ribosome maturation factor RimP [Ignavibacteriales bacterium]